jgi:hypothetical protein
VRVQETSPEEKAQVLDCFAAEDALVRVGSEANGVQHSEYCSDMGDVLLLGVAMDEKVVNEAHTEAGEAELGYLRIHDALAKARGVLEAVAAASVHPEFVAPPEGGKILVVGMDREL